MIPTIDDIRAAAETIAGHVERTPTIHCAALTHRLGIDISLKLESLQRTGSFKERGAVNKLSSLADKERKAGVIACSAGNHAQGVSYHATKMNIPALIVMPQNTPFSKVERTESFGAKVILKGDTLTESAHHMQDLVTEHDYTVVHPYNDPKVVAGQGTIGLEILEDIPDLDTIVVPVGGGGMISGIAIAAKSIKPDIEIIGVESEAFTGMTNALAGKPPPAGMTTVADGIAVKEPAPLNVDIVRTHVDRMDVVSEQAIELAIHRYLSSAKLVAEGAAATALATVMENPDRFSNKKVGLVLCGGNIDGRLLSSVLMRALVRGGQIVSLRMEIPDQPGVLATISKIIGKANANIIEVIHQRLLQGVPLKGAELDVVIETRDEQHVKTIISELEEQGFKTRLMNGPS